MRTTRGGNGATLGRNCWELASTVQTSSSCWGSGFLTRGDGLKPMIFCKWWGISIHKSQKMGKGWKRGILGLICSLFSCYDFMLGTFGYTHFMLPYVTFWCFSRWVSGKDLMLKWCVDIWFESGGWFVVALGALVGCIIAIDDLMSFFSLMFFFPSFLSSVSGH